MEYKLITKEEKDEVMANFLKAQEMDHYTHSINLQRFKELEKTLPVGEFKSKIVNEIPIIQSRIDEIEKIVAATVATSQLPDDASLLSAKERIDAKQVIN